MPALTLLPAAGAAQATVHRVTLSGPEPLAQLARLWSYGAVRRIVVRPEAAWWPAPYSLPDRWQAWVDLRDGAAVHIVARGQTTSLQVHPVAKALLRLLTAPARLERTPYCRMIGPAAIAPTGSVTSNVAP